MKDDGDQVLLIDVAQRVRALLVCSRFGRVAGGALTREQATDRVLGGRMPPDEVQVLENAVQRWAHVDGDAYAHAVRDHPDLRMPSLEGWVPADGMPNPMPPADWVRAHLRQLRAELLDQPDA